MESANPVRLFDRLTGRLVPPPDGRVPLGRYMIPTDEHTLLLDTRRAAPGDYLVGREGNWLLRADQRTWWSGDFGHRPLPDPLVVDNVLQVGDTVTEAVKHGAPLAEWISTPPVVTDTDSRLRPHPLEDRIRAELGFVRAVCRAPHARLRTEHTLVPVSRARSITWRTVVHLSAHSETWAARRLRGVEPAQLLTPVRVPDYDLYENRVVAALVDRLWQHVLARSAELESIASMVERGQDLLSEAAARPNWRGRARLYEMISRLLDGQKFDEEIEQLRGQLNALRNALAPQLDSRLRKGIRTPYDGRPELRPTNLFLNDANYRHSRDLWNSWVKLRGKGDANTDPHSRMAAWCRSFAQFVLLLVVQALDELGLQAEPEPTVESLGPDELRLRYRYHADALWLSRNSDDTFVLRLRGRQVLRMVPLPHALTASGDPEEITSWLSKLATTNREPLVIFYPGEPAERERLPIHLRLAVHGVHGGWGSSGPAAPTFVPVSPSDIDSVARVGRLLRAALVGPVLAEFPVRVPCRAEFVAPVAKSLNWVEPGRNEIIVVRPPSPEELDAMPSSIDQLGIPTSHVRQRGDHQQKVDGLVRALHDGAEGIRRLLRCPICSRLPTRSDQAFQRRGDTYRCACDHCGSIWENRRCVKCSDRYAVLTTTDSEGKIGGDGDRLDRTFAQDLLAAPCWKRTRSYLCPSCGYCAEARPDSKREDCARCAPE